MAEPRQGQPLCCHAIRCRAPTILPGHDDGFRADELVLTADLADTGKLYNHPKLRQAFGNAYVLFDYPSLNFCTQRKNTYAGTELSVGAVWGDQILGLVLARELESQPNRVTSGSSLTLCR